VVSRWLQDSEYARLKEIKEIYYFTIHSVADDRLIGQIALPGFDWAARNTWLGIGLVEREYWGKGFGMDATNVILGFAFRELNLHRVNLNGFEYNPRAIHCYEKVGFTHEGQMRNCLNRDGRRWDLVYMGILRSEWEDDSLRAYLWSN
jgi:RimJ/RimL family protein N-acetyltransferase